MSRPPSDSPEPPDPSDSPEPPEPEQRRLRPLIWLLALGPFAVLVQRFSFVCDDAWISFRYARNVARGLGPIYNPGEAPVEGYSEPLWVALMAAVEGLGADPAFWSRALSIGAAALLVALALVAIEVLTRPRPAAFAAGALLLGCSPSLSVWATGGMATAPFACAAFALFASFYLWKGPCTPLAVLSACLLVLLRADGAYWVAALCGPALVAGWFGPRAILRSAAIASGVSALVFGAHVAWRLAYYGDWLPNTARAKLGFSPRAFERGGEYVAHYFLTFPGLALALILAGLLTRASVRRAPGPGRRGSWRLAAWSVVSATLAYAVVVGGDFMCFGRFLVPALPFLALLLADAAASVERALERRGTRLAGGMALALGLACAVPAALPAFGLHPVPRSLRAQFQFRWNADAFLSERAQWERMVGQAREWADLGRALKRHSSPGDSLVFGAVGAVGYFSELFIHDKNGLVTREVALREPLEGRNSPGHDKTVPPTFFLKYRPTYLDACIYPMDRRRYPLASYWRGPLETEARSEALGLPLGLYVIPGE